MSMRKAKKVVIINQKGGVGKSTISVNLSYGVARKGLKTLLIDLDPQSHSSCIYIKDIDKKFTVSNLFLERSYDISNVIFPAQNRYDVIENLFVIPSTIHLALVAEQVISATYRETLLHKHLESVSGKYDFIIADCPPTLGVITINAIYTADMIIIPTNYGRYSLDGIADLFKSIKEIKDGHNYCFWILRNMHEKKNSQTNQYIEHQLNDLKEHTYKTIIRKNEAINQSQINGDPVFVFNANSSGSQDFNQLVEEFLINVEN